MRKTGNKSFAISAAYLVITLILCTGIIFYTNNGGTGKTFADITDTMPDTGSDEIVAGEEEVPLGQAPKVTVKTSKKTTTKKKKLKKASKKTKTTTKKKTSTKKSASVQTVTETTVQTTQKTSIKKKSKVKTIKTTVVTTVKTTETNLGITTSKSSNEASDNTAAATSGFAINDFSDIKGHVDSRVYNAFVNLGFGFKVNSKLGTTGVFSVQNHNIQLKRGQSSYLLHELGHFAAALKGRADQTSEFKKIYNTEKNAYVGNNKAYVTQDAGEYFAESFRDYTENASVLKSQCPQTYNYINGLVNSISDKDVSNFYNTYGLCWNNH